MVSKTDVLDEISFIKKVMEDSRRGLIGDSNHYIVWGIIVVLGMLASYFRYFLDLSSMMGWVWAGLIAIGWIYSIVRGSRQGSSARHRSFGTTIINGIWIAAGISMTIVGFAGIYSGAIKVWAITPLIAIILGIPSIATGVVHGLPWLRNMAALWWIGGLIMLLWPGSYIPLAFAGMMIALQIVPGIILTRKWKRELGVQ